MAIMNATSSRPIIMVVDDDSDLRFLLTEAFGLAGYEVITAADGQEALEVYETNHPALVVLDVMMPDMDGWEVLRELRARSDVPVLMLTALSRESDQLHGLEGGADDYVTKPFSVHQVIARVGAILRRTGYGGKTIVCGPITLDAAAHEVIVDDRLIPLTGREYTLLEVLVRNPGRAFTRDELLARCWESGYMGVDRVIDVHLASLRRKLGKRRNMISTVRGVGYKLDVS